MPRTFDHDIRECPDGSFELTDARGDALPFMDAFPTRRDAEGALVELWFSEREDRSGVVGETIQLSRVA